MMDVSVGSDYAVMEGPKFKAYYGYEEVDKPTQNWCFVVWKNGKEVFRRTTEELAPIANGYGPAEMLLLGLALYMNK